MINMKDIEKGDLNYAISVVPGTYKMKRHWMKQGDSEEVAIDKAINYAKSVLVAANLSEKREDYIGAFEELAAVSNAVVELLKQT